MSEWFGEKVFTIGILGGGRGGLGLLKFFGNNQVTRVTFLVDGNPNAPGVVEARPRASPPSRRRRAALRDNLPGLPVRHHRGRRAGGPDQGAAPGHHHPLDHPHHQPDDGGRPEHERRRGADDISEIVATIQEDLGRSLDTSTSVVSRINSIMSNMQMLALNASIEAAKAGRPRPGLLGGGRAPGQVRGRGAQPHPGDQPGEPEHHPGLRAQRQRCWRS